MLKLIEDAEQDTEHESMFDVLESEYSVDELDIRENPDGFVLAQSPEGTTVDVRTEEGTVVVDEVNAGDVDFDQQEELDDVFDDSVVAE